MAGSIYYFSREEPRLHVHVHHSDGEAKFWLEPEIELAANAGLKPRQVAEALESITRHEDEIRVAWEKHFRD